MFSELKKEVKYLWHEVRELKQEAQEAKQKAQEAERILIQWQVAHGVNRR